MKKLTVVVSPGKLETVKQIFESCAVYGMMITNIMGYGNQKGYVKVYNGIRSTTNVLMKVKIETVADDETISILSKLLVDKLNTGNYGDGKIFIRDVKDVIRIRTDERGEEAL